MTRARFFFQSFLIGYLGVVVLVTAAGVGLLKLNHMHILDVQTGSMAPTFHSGDAVLSQAMQGHAQVSVGDVVSYVSQQDGRTITHRVVRVDTAHGQVTTRGDALSKSDTPIARTAISGKVVAVLPQLGRVLDFVRRPVGLAILVYLPALGTVFNEVKSLSRHYGRGRYRVYGYR